MEDQPFFTRETVVTAAWMLAFVWSVDIEAKSATSWKSLFLGLVAVSDIQYGRQYEAVMKIVYLLSVIHLQLAMISELVGST